MKTASSSITYGTLVLSIVLGCIDTAHAQSNTITTTPTNLSFSSPTGANPSPQTVTLTSSAGAINYSATAFPSWLSVSPGSGNTATDPTLTVSVNVAGLSPGNYGGNVLVQCTCQGGGANIPVSLTVGGTTGTGQFSSTPASLTFPFAAGAFQSQSQQLTVSSTGSSVNIQATAATNTGGPWLSVSPTFALGTPAVFTVTANPSGLASGTYTGAINISQQGSSTTVLSVPVTMTIGAVPTITVAPTQLAFAYQIGTAAPPAQSVNVTASGGANVAFSAAASSSTCGSSSSWLVVNPQSSATPSALTVQINTTGLTTTANCTGQITISAPGASNSTIMIPVTLFTSTNPILFVPTSTVNFTFQPGTATPANQNVQITSSGAAASFSVTTAPATAGGPNFLTVTPTTGNASTSQPATLTLGINAAVLQSLAPGTYTVNVSVSSPSNPSQPVQTFPVTLTVSNNATLTASQPSATFNFQIGQAQPQSQTITLNSTGAPVTFNVAATSTNCGNFLSVSPTTGITPSNTGQAAQLIVSANLTGLTAATTCTGNIAVTAVGSSTPLLNIPVTVNVSTTPLINVSPAAVSATIASGTTTFTSQNISLTSTDSFTPLNFTATAATNPPGLTWLLVSPNAGSTPANLQVLLNPTGLQPGTYNGSIVISSTSPNVPTQNIPVTLVISGPPVTASATSLTFSQAQNGPAPASQTVTLTGVPAGSTIGATTTTFSGGTGWLTATVTSNNSVSVSVNGGALAQGTYTGTVTIIVPGASNSPINIQVTLNVVAAQTITLSANALTFNFAAGSTTTPPTQTVQVNSTGGPVPFTATTTTSVGANFLTVTPTSGTTPATLTIGLNQQVISTLSPGSFTNAVTISSPSIPGGSQSVTVTLTVAAAPAPALTFVENAASLQPGPIAPGEIVAIFGTNLGPAQPVGLQLTSAGTVATTLGGTQVLFDNIPAPLTFVSANQINAIVPYEVAGRLSTNLTVMRNGVVSSGISLQVIATSPAIFTLTQNGQGQGAILNQNGTVNGAANPAPKGSVIAIYATGEGQLQNGGVTGSVTPTIAPFPKPVGNVSVMIGGVPAQVQFSGEAPGLVSGVLQVNVTVPSTIGSGNQTVVLTVGTNSSPTTATVAVQ